MKAFFAVAVVLAVLGEPRLVSETRVIGFTVRLERMAARAISSGAQLWGRARRRRRVARRRRHLKSSRSRSTRLRRRWRACLPYVNVISLPHQVQPLFHATTAPLPAPTHKTHTSPSPFPPRARDANNDAGATASAQDPAKFYKTPTEAAEANNLIAFAAAVKDNGLGPALNKPGLVATVFAPSDAAFKELADSTDPAVQKLLADKKAFADVLKYHVVPGATLTGNRVVKMVADAPNGKVPFGTLQGEKLNATIIDGSLAANGVPIEGVDVQGGKVMIHTISHVLLPPSMMPPAASKEVAEGAGKADKGDAAAKASGAAGLAASLALALPVAVAALL